MISFSAREHKTTYNTHNFLNHYKLDVKRIEKLDRYYACYYEKDIKIFFQLISAFSAEKALDSISWLIDNALKLSATRVQNSIALLQQVDEKSVSKRYRSYFFHLIDSLEAQPGIILLDELLPIILKSNACTRQVNQTFRHLLILIEKPEILVPLKNILCINNTRAISNSHLEQYREYILMNITTLYTLEATALEVMQPVLIDVFNAIFLPQCCYPKRREHLFSKLLNFIQKISQCQSLVEKMSLFVTHLRGNQLLSLETLSNFLKMPCVESLNNDEISTFLNDIAELYRTDQLDKNSLYHQFKSYKQSLPSYHQVLPPHL